MRSRFSASAISSSSASPRVPTSENALQQVAVGEVLACGHELALVLARGARASSRRQAGSTFRNVYLTK